jgi:HPt (histidine-containing phosphotransfer) domain-containing protein
MKSNVRIYFLVSTPFCVIFPRDVALMKNIHEIPHGKRFFLKWQKFLLPLDLQVLRIEQGVPTMITTENLEVVVPAILMDLVPKYLENRKAEIHSLGEALAQRDFTAIKNVGHKLKGNAGSYGFTFLSELGLIIEKAAASQDVTALQNALASYENYLNRVRVKSDAGSST